MGNEEVDMSNKKAIYLGDGAYAMIEYGDVVLYTSDGAIDKNHVVLGPSELRTFLNWLRNDLGVDY